MNVLGDHHPLPPPNSSNTRNIHEIRLPISVADVENAVSMIDDARTATRRSAQAVLRHGPPRIAKGHHADAFVAANDRIAELGRQPVGHQGGAQGLRARDGFFYACVLDGGQELGVVGVGQGLVDDGGARAVHGLQGGYWRATVEIGVDVRVGVRAGEIDKGHLHGGRPDPIVARDFRCRVAILCLHLIDGKLGDDIGGALASVPEGDGDGASAVVRIGDDTLEVGLVGVGDGGHGGIESAVAGRALRDVFLGGPGLRVSEYLVGGVEAVCERSLC